MSEYIIRGKFRELAAMLEQAEQKAREMEMFVTMHAINAAKNKAGWECAYKLNKIKSRQPRGDA